MQDGGKVTPTELATLQYIAESYKLDKKAQAAMDTLLPTPGASEAFWTSVAGKACKYNLNESTLTAWTR